MQSLRQSYGRCEFRTPSRCRRGHKLMLGGGETDAAALVRGGGDRELQRSIDDVYCCTDLTGLKGSVGGFHSESKKQGQ